MKLQIPDIAYEGLKLLSKMTKKEAKAVFDILENVEPDMNWESLRIQIEKSGKPGGENAIAVLDAIKGLYDLRLRNEQTVSQLVSDVVESVRASEIAKEVKPDVLTPRLEKALSFNKTLGITAKAENVMFEHQNVYVESRILTDLRPIFFENEVASIAANSIIHNLRITYLEDNGLKKAVFAMDSDDLVKLEEVIKRAKQKEKAIRLNCKKTETPCLEGRK